MTESNRDSQDVVSKDDEQPPSLLYKFWGNRFGICQGASERVLERVYQGVVIRVLDGELNFEEKGRLINYINDSLADLNRQMEGKPGLVNELVNTTIDNYIHEGDFTKERFTKYFRENLRDCEIAKSSEQISWWRNPKYGIRD
ncbi:MAG: hypothetical protein KKA64_01590 [Nanoarchaeota archaeon]|nr:hypothetical protein [Nanoarchaeota archaeon]